MSKRKIMIIAPVAFGYTSYIYKALLKFDHISPSIVYIDGGHFRYKSFLHRIFNFFSKVFFNVNLKKREILQRLKAYGNQDEIFMIRPDLLDDYVLKKIKGKTTKLTAFYFDSIGHFPRKESIRFFFDHIFSFDKEDVKNYGFEFCTNYIYEECEDKKAIETLFFNISSINKDRTRFQKLIALAEYLKSKHWSYNFNAVETKQKTKPNELVSIQHKIIPVDEIKNHILKSKIIVEFQRQNQMGLSFRVFEALGYRKKLITTNRDIVNYDFYHSQNILVLDPDNIQIPESFVTSEYKEIPAAVLAPYRIENWVVKVFNLGE